MLVSDDPVLRLEARPVLRVIRLLIRSIALIVVPTEIPVPVMV